MKRRLFAMLLSAVMLTALLTGCGGKDSGSGGSSSGDSGSGEPKKAVSLWATGSDNVREIFEALVSAFNTNSEYAGQYEVTLQFMLSGTGAQTLADMLSAASKAGQTNTDYDIVDLSGDDLSKLVSLIGQEQFVKLDSAKIPNAASVEAKSSIADGYCQPTAAPPSSWPMTPPRFPRPPPPWMSWWSG